MGFRLSTRVPTDLDEIADHVGRNRGDAAAERLLAMIARRFVLLGEKPYIGRTRDHDLGPGRRSSLVGTYAIIYSIAGQDAVVLRVAHGRRDLPRLEYDD